jgi:hypothetical protein
MPYTSALHDETLHRSSSRHNFIGAYGPDANLKALYKAQPGVWQRFAPLYPRVAYLLDSLYWIYSAIDVALLDFKAALVAHDTSDDWDKKVGAPYDVTPDPFAFFLDSKIEASERSCLLHIRWALRRSRGTALASLFRECAHDVLTAARTEERGQIRQELLEKKGEVADALNVDFADLDSGIWNARRRILIREDVIDDALSRIKAALDENDIAVPVAEPDNFAYETNGQYEYGGGSIPGTSLTRRSARFADELLSPPRSVSPNQRLSRGRHGDDRIRSASRDSRRSSIAPGSSITTAMPEMPADPFELSVSVLSTTTNTWKTSLAILDSGCDGGNFISSSFLDHLEMSHVAEDDSEAASITLMDFSGKTDFKSVGRVRLKWYGREIDKGSGKGKRSIFFTDWFNVAPPLPADGHGEPFEMLLGKDWIVSVYPGISALANISRTKMRSFRIVV